MRIKIATGMLEAGDCEDAVGEELDIKPALIQSRLLRKNRFLV